jgi:bifunctional UDP-N-acetylglucosamine pyrophosphorylase/glucosamine-1-phosphate N-acetyltransferase
MNNITAVILAAGAGTRMKTDLAKVLHKVGSRTILERVIDNIENSGISDIITVVGHQAEKIEKLFENRTRFRRQTKLLGSGDALKKAVGGISERVSRVLVTCGDTPFISGGTLRALVEKCDEGKASCALLTCVLDDAASYGRIIRDSSGDIARIVEEKDLRREDRDINEINVGTYCFLRSDLEEFITKIEQNDKKKEFYLTDIVDILKKSGKKIVSGKCPKKEALGINSRRDLAEANKVLNSLTIDRVMEEGVTIVDASNTYIDEDASVGKDTVIFPNTVIEGDVKISEKCSIGPFARLRRGTRLAGGVEIGNFVELCRTEIGENTKVKHHTYLGDTVVGKDVNIGAGTITANYDGEKKHRTVIEDGAFIGVGTMIVAPSRIGKGAKTGAGSVLTKKEIAEGETWAGVPASKLIRKQKKGQKT